MEKIRKIRFFSGRPRVAPTIFVGTAAKRLPLEGKLSAKLTDEVGGRQLLLTMPFGEFALRQDLIRPCGFAWGHLPQRGRLWDGVPYGVRFVSAQQAIDFRCHCEGEARGNLPIRRNDTVAEEDVLRSPVIE